VRVGRSMGVRGKRLQRGAEPFERGVVVGVRHRADHPARVAELHREAALGLQPVLGVVAGDAQFRDVDTEFQRVSFGDAVVPDDRLVQHRESVHLAQALP
jgi:hypothetical protein